MSDIPVIDYTNKDYASLRKAMLDLARYRLPEWTDLSPGDPGVLLVDLFAYMGDIILYYQDRIANESFLPTAQERLSVIHLLRLIGYELKTPVSAYADLTLLFNTPGPGEPTDLVIPYGARFTGTAVDNSSQSFEYLGADIQLDLLLPPVTGTGDGKYLYEGLPVRHSRAIAPEIPGSSTGEGNQAFKLKQRPVIPESIYLEVNEGAGWVPWQRRENLLYHIDIQGRVVTSGPASRDYYIQFDQDGYAWIFFGDGRFGKIPPPGTNNIKAVYRVGGGTIGNVPAGAIGKAETAIPYLDTVTNPLAAAGGTDAETIEHAKRFGPLCFRSGHRAVTLNDFIALAHQAGGVSKVRAKSRSWNHIDLYIAPEGDYCRPVPDDLRARLLAYFEDKRMVTTIVHIHDAVAVPIDISLDVIVEPPFDRELVRQDVHNALMNLLAYINVDFGQTLYLSKVYEAIEKLEGVHAVTVTRFMRQQEGYSQQVQAVLDQFQVSLVEDLPEVIQQSLNLELSAEGRILFTDIEIPIPGNLAITLDGETA